MISTLRQVFNKKFNTQRYQAMLQQMNQVFDYAIPFRVAETPIFIPDDLKQHLLKATDEIVEIITQENFKALTQGALFDERIIVPNENGHTHFLQLDFAVCQTDDRTLFPQLIEIQGFPALYYFLLFSKQHYEAFFDIPGDFTPFFSEQLKADYQTTLQKIIIGGYTPKEVVMLEIEPKKQATYIDFLLTEQALGIKVLCITELKKDGKQLYYLDEDNQRIPIKRIYNRVIFEELWQRSDLEIAFNFTDEMQVEWAGHPNWFFRISKYLLPFLKGKYVPQSYHLDQLNAYPNDLENYVLKPLFSFSGCGVELNPTAEILDSITNKSLYILQRKVEYAPVLDTPTGYAKMEIRLLLLWPDGENKPILTSNLIRLTKGEMVGVKYNKNKDWVGASLGYFKN